MHNNCYQPVWTQLISKPHLTLSVSFVLSTTRARALKSDASWQRQQYQQCINCSETPACIYFSFGWGVSGCRHFTVTSGLTWDPAAHLSVCLCVVQAGFSWQNAACHWVAGCWGNLIYIFIIYIMTHTITKKYDKCWDWLQKSFSSLPFGSFFTSVGYNLFDYLWS